MNPKNRLLVCLVATLPTACSSPRDTLPQVRELYREAALREARNPVVVIHGILGARLVQRSTGKTVWGAFTSDAIDPQTPEGALALAVPLPGDLGAMAYDPETADVVAEGPLDALDVGLLFGVINVDIYASILRALGVGGYTDPVSVDPATPAYAEDHFTCLTFFYDWRRDNVENAIAFGRFLERSRLEIDRRARNKIDVLRAEGDPKSLHIAAELEGWLAEGYRFDVVAHSMGGLIARYFLRYGIQDLPQDGSELGVTWAGADQIDRLVVVGTPNLGAMDALVNLLRGYQPGFLLPYYHPVVLGTMPALYQLLPRNGQGLVVDQSGAPAALDLFDVDTWDRNGWGILDPASDRYLQWLQPGVEDPGERRFRARSYLSWCLQRARGFHRALDREPDLPCPVQVRLFAADTIDTIAKTRLQVRDDGTSWPRFSGEDLFLPGDGTVPRYSAVGDRRQGGPATSWLDSPVPWTSVTFLPDDHIGLTRNPLFTDNLLFFLLEQRPRRRSR